MEPPEGPSGAPYPQPMMPPSRSRGPRSNVLVILAGVIVGALIFAGSLSFHAVFLIPAPCQFCSTDPAVVSYRETVRLLGWISAIAMDLAVAFSVTLAWVVSGLKSDFAESSRRGVFIFATVFLAVWIVFSFTAYAAFRSLLSF